MFGRIAFFLLAGTLAFCVAAFVFDWRVTLPPALADAIGWRAGMSDEEIVRDDLSWHVNDKRAAVAVEDAVARNDAEDTAVYLAIADDLGVPLAGGLRAAALAVEMHDSSPGEVFSDYVGGFLSGSGDSVAGLAGAISSDLTVYGDLRDIVREGGKMLVGEEYSELLLGLSAVGVAATAATVATGGGGILVKAGISFVKFAARAGHMTKAFTVRLLRLTNDAIDMPAFRRMLKEIDLADPEGAWKAVQLYSRGIKGARIFEVMGKLEDIRATVGTAEALRLMKRMNRIEDVDDIHGLVKASGKRARGIMEMTGKESLRAIKYVANILQILVHYVWALLLWILGLLAAILHRVLVSAWRICRTVMRYGKRRAKRRGLCLKPLTAR